MTLDSMMGLGNRQDVKVTKSSSRFILILLVTVFKP